MSKAVKQIRGKFADEKYLGPEPVLNENATDAQIGRAFSWFNYFYSNEDAKTFLLSYMKEHKFSKEDLQKISNIEDWKLTVTGWMARLVSNGSFLPNSIRARFKENLAGFLASETVQNVETTEKVVDIQKRITDKTNELIGDLEILIDNFILTGSTFDFASWLKENNVKPAIAEKIVKHYEPLYKELSSAYNKEDTALVEAYSSHSRSSLKKYVDLIGTIVNAPPTVTNVAKKPRKPRKRKIKPASVIVSKVKYQKNNADLGIESLSPTEIIGANQLWVFNTKTRKLYVYNASATSGLNVKGTTIIGFDEKTSYGKTLRKPKEKLKELTASGKVALRKFMDTIRSKPAAANGRINKDMILIKAIK